MPGMPVRPGHTPRSCFARSRPFRRGRKGRVRCVPHRSPLSWRGEGIWGGAVVLDSCLRRNDVSMGQE